MERQAEEAAKNPAGSRVPARCNGEMTLGLFPRLSSLYSFLRLTSVGLGSEGHVSMQGSLHSQHVIQAPGRRLPRPCWMPGTAAAAAAGAEEELGADSRGQVEEHTDTRLHSVAEETEASRGQAISLMD